jgi:hypothetical protein
MHSFHGREFFPGGIALDDPITILSAGAAFVGLIILVRFTAPFTQRVFAREVTYCLHSEPNLLRCSS